MRITKRNGESVEFNKDKVTNAIHKASLEVLPESTWKEAELLANMVVEKCEEMGEGLTVEKVQDMIEDELIVSNKDIAKRFIIYRDEKHKKRKKRSRYKLLSDEFLSQYKHRTPPLNALGIFVFYRTYSRYIPEEGRREMWYETLARAVDYNCSLSKNTTKEEAEELYDNLFNLRQQLSGRTLYTGNTKASLLYPLSNFNCSFLILDKIDAFADLFYVLMVGTGAGVSVQMKYSEQMPPFRTDINMYHEEWEFTPKEFREEVTTSEVNGDTIKIVVGDSKEGFMEALRLYLNILTNNSYRTITNILINYNYIRPKGERLMTFGGTASGHESMKNMLHKIHKVVLAHKNEGRKVQLERIDLLDIANIIGENVVSGGVRRTAEIILVDSDDEESKLAKSNLYQQNEDGEWEKNKAISHRSVSNNSVIYEKKPSRETLHEHIKMMRYSGEPGMINAEAASKRRPFFKGTNPCGEILLDANAVCNLTTNNVLAFIENGVLNREKLIRAFELSARAGYRMTMLELELPHWNMVHKRDRLLGVSMTGYQDAVTSLNMSIEEQKTLLKELREAAHRAMKQIAKEEGLGESILVTTVKPEGCWTKEFTRVTDQGILFINEIEGTVDDAYGFHEVLSNVTVRGNKVSKVYKNDIKDIYKITLKNGRILKISPSHPMSVNGKWVKAKDLKISDMIDYELGNYSNKCEASLIDISDNEMKKHRSDMRDYNTPNKMTQDLAWLIGAYFANGSFTTNDRIKFHAQHLELHKHVQGIWKELFGVETTIYKSSDRDSYTQDFRSTKIRKWLAVNGIQKREKGNEMIIPRAIRQSSKESILAFIVGYADNDGCFTKKSFCVDSADEKFLRHLQEVGEAVGLSFGLSVNRARDNSFSKKNMYKLHLSRAFSEKSSIEFINSISIKAQFQGLVESGAIRSKNPYIVEKIEIEKEQQTYDIEVEDEHWYYQGGLKSHNTLSQVMGGVSSGLHFSHDEYYIRRIRINANDALVKVCEDLGWTIHIEAGETEENCTTKVIDFPVHSPATKFKKDVSAIEQLEIYKMFQEYYTDHNTSNTVHVRDNEWGDVEEWLWNNWDDFIGVSFLSESDSFYPLMPYESVDKETYERLRDSMKEFNPSMLKKYETTGESDLDAETCASGACAVR